MNEILTQIIEEAAQESIIIDGDLFPVAFNTVIYEDGKEVLRTNSNDNYPTLIIKDMAKFIDKLVEYIELALIKINKFPSFSKNAERNKVKFLITYLFVNATTEDFSNPIELLERNIAFLNDDTFDYLKAGILIPLNSFDKSSILIKNSSQSAFMETPNKMEISLVKDGKSYVLPSISYGIRVNNNKRETYVYTIINPKSKKEELTTEQIKYSKKIGRELYKLNNGVLDSESEEYKAYISGNNQYYPENISDVSPSAVLSLLIFMGILETENIDKIKIVPYLPIRFFSRQIFAQNQTDKARVQELEERNITLQNNITNKFIRTFRRVAFHLKELEVTSLPYEGSEYLEMHLKNTPQPLNNDILNDVYNSTLNNVKKGVIKK